MSDKDDLQQLKLSDERLKLLNELLQRKGVLPQQNKILAYPRPLSKNIPLSFAQQRLWFLDQLEPQNTAYNMPAAFRITGMLNKAALEYSFNEIIRRHEILRTTFVTLNGQPVQCILPFSSSPILFTDLHTLPDREQKADLEQLMATAAAISFDLAKGPLLYIHLIQVNDQEHILLITLHHIIADSWSVDILIREFSLLYRASLHGQLKSLPELKLQYADYTLWQREQPQLDGFTNQLDYWKQQLASAPNEIESLTDRPQSTKTYTLGATCNFVIPQSLSKALRILAQREGVTLFMLLLSTWLTFLYHYTKQEDLVIGTPVASRDHPELEELIGLFVNMVALRADMSGNPSFRELLNRVRKTTLDAYAHDDLPFDRVVAGIRPNHKRHHNPLFQVVFTLQSRPAMGFDLPDVQFIPIQVKNETVPYNLVLDLIEDTNGLYGIFTYSTDLFDSTTVERMGIYYGRLLASIIDHPECEIDTLAYLMQDSTQDQLNSETRIFTVQETFYNIPDLFAEQVRRTPDALAVLFEEMQLSYRDLHERSNRLANYLYRHGVGPEVRVGIYCKRSIELIVGILGILKTGGAYIPIDPATPPERLEFMLTSAQITLVLTQQHLVEDLLPQNTRRIYLDTNWQDIELESDELPPYKIHPDNLAYIIFTSGSTGQPKGVLVSHRGLANLAREHIDAYRVEVHSHVLQFASISFDASVAELMMALLAGATLCLGFRHKARAGTDLLETLRAQAITVVCLTPSVLATLPTTNIPTLRTLIVAGEAAPGELLARWVTESRHVYNAYGPTEITVCATIEAIESDCRLATLGPAISHTQFYILDQHLRPVPSGVVGEIFIGGIGIARGYLNNSALTAERFIPDPFSAIPGARLYRTGDLARYLPGGKSIFLRRVDEQIKFRGYRIEPGEIEYVLVTHPSIQQAAVVLREDTPGTQKLVAYLVLRQTSFRENDVRKYVGEKLPDYMVPATYVILDVLPTTLSGKLDRSALPAPEKAGSSLEGEGYIAPRSQLEERLTQIWCEILGVEHIGIHDNFFELGGHSLLATLVVSRLQETFQVEISLATFMQRSTVADWVQILKESIGNAPKTPSKRLILPVPRDGELPLSYAQQHLWAAHQLEPDNVAYNVFTAFRMQGILDISAFQRSITEISRRHEVLRTTFAMGTGLPLQSIAAPAPIVLPVIDISELELAQREAELMRLATQEANTPFDLCQGPLLRVVLVCLTQDQYMVLITMHHIVTDGWSIALVAKELSLLYTAYTQGLSSPLPEPTIQYADYAAWQRTWLQSPQLEKQLSFWQQQLAGAPAQLALPTDYPRTERRDPQGATYSTLLNEELTMQLKSLSQQEDATLFITVLAAWTVLLYQQTNQQDIVVGTSIAGRNYAEIEDLVGFFVNTLPLRIKFTGNPSFRRTIQHAKYVALEAFDNQDIPFNLLVSELHPERIGGVTPIFQVLLTFHNTKPAEIHLADIKLSQIEIELPTAKYDIVLIIDEQDSKLSIRWNYNTSLFKEITIARWASQYEAILQQVTRHPDTLLSRLKGNEQGDKATDPGYRQRKNARRNALGSTKPQEIQLQEEDKI